MHMRLTHTPLHHIQAHSMVQCQLLELHTSKFGSSLPRPKLVLPSRLSSTRSPCSSLGRRPPAPLDSRVAHHLTQVRLLSRRCSASTLSSFNSNSSNIYMVSHIHSVHNLMPAHNYALNMLVPVTQIQ